MIKGEAGGLKNKGEGGMQPMETTATTDMHRFERQQRLRQKMCDTILWLSHIKYRNARAFQMITDDVGMNEREMMGALIKQDSSTCNRIRRAINSVLADYRNGRV